MTGTLMIPQRDPNETYRDALVDARQLSTDALLSLTDALSFEVADDDPDWPGAIGRYLAGERLRAVRTELERRIRLVATGKVANAGQTYARWRDLARVIRDRVEVPLVFQLAGYELRPAGRNGRRGVAEYAGPCPVCGGTDRLRVWAGPNGRAWCRHCRWSADALTAAQSLFGEGFRDTARRLAAYVGEAA